MSEERKTVRVRIAVAVSRTGAWAAYGWQTANGKPKSDSDVLREMMEEDVYGVDAVTRPSIGVTCLCGNRTNADEFAKTVGGTVIPLVRQGSPRGVVVTERQRDTVVWAGNFFSGYGAHIAAKELSSLLDAIDAAKGGGA